MWLRLEVIRKTNLNKCRECRICPCNQCFTWSAFNLGFVPDYQCRAVEGVLRVWGQPCQLDCRHVGLNHVKF